MIIAINTRQHLNTYRNNSAKILYRYCMKMLETEPAYRFIFFSDDPHFNNESGIKEIIITPLPEIKNMLSLRFWYHFQLPSLVKKHKADLLIHTGNIFCKTKIPQLLFAPDLSYLEHPAMFHKNLLQLLQKETARSIQSAAAIITFSESAKNAIAAKFKSTENKIDLLPLLADNDFHPIDYAEKETVKEKYAEEKEFYLYTGPVHDGSNLINLLKAFSIFKKRQKSNMLLLIVATSIQAGNRFREDLQSYKYRNDVKFWTNLPETTVCKITAAAYAVVSPAMIPSTDTNLINAINCHVPVICSRKNPMSEVFSGACLYADPENIEELADQLMLLFKNEDLRAELIFKAKAIIHEPDSGRANEILQQIFKKALN